MVVLSITLRRPRGDTKQASVRSQAGLPQWRRSKLALTGDPAAVAVEKQGSSSKYRPHTARSNRAEARHSVVQRREPTETH